MSEPIAANRLSTLGLRLSATELARLGEIVTDVERISAWLHAEPRSYLEEPVTVFRAPQAGPPAVG